VAGAQIAEMLPDRLPGIQIYPAPTLLLRQPRISPARRRTSSCPFGSAAVPVCQVVGIESGGDVKGCPFIASSVHGENRFVEGNLRKKACVRFGIAADAFAYNRLFKQNSWAASAAFVAFVMCVAAAVAGPTMSGWKRKPELFLSPGGQAPALRSACEEPTAEETSYSRAHASGRAWDFRGVTDLARVRRNR